MGISSTTQLMQSTAMMAATRRISVDIAVEVLWLAEQISSRELPAAKQHLVQPVCSSKQHRGCRYCQVLL
jgi:hypothetical protein